MLDEIATKLLQATNNSNNFGTAVTITGVGGFGKTTAVVSLCHHPLVKEYFTDGFVFVELGPQATDPSVKLFQLYHLLTGEHLKYCDISIVQQELKQQTNAFYRNLLVIIDDVWHIEDAEPLVNAFINCKIILTTRMKNIEQHIPSQQSVIIGPMTQNEAISLLTNEVIDNSQLSQEDKSLLNKLAQDVHLWPLLLSLIRGQLSRNLTQYHCNIKPRHLSYHKAIESVRAKLRHKGLTAFDIKNIKRSHELVAKENIKRSRKLAVKACIEVTLELLEQPMSDKLKSLIIWTGIGTSLQTAVLHNLWNISEEEAEDILDTLWNYGLVQFSNISVSHTSITQYCVEVHAVISKYIFDFMTVEEAHNLTNLPNAHSIHDGMGLVYKKLHGVSDESSLSHEDYLKYVINQIENAILPYFIKSISMYTASDPHKITQHFPLIVKQLPKLEMEITALFTECERILKKEIPDLCRKFNQTAQRNLFEKNYDELIKTVEDFIKNYPLCDVAQRAVTILNELIQNCNDQLLLLFFKRLQLNTRDNHYFTTLSLPLIKLHVKVHREISFALQNRSDIEKFYHYMTSGKFNDDYELVRDNSDIKHSMIIPELYKYSDQLTTPKM